LVQKKTFTPDYLTHEKKRNNGEEEFIIIKDHHEPIISRELFRAANQKLDEAADSPEGKSKHSKRYAFSGKIVCGKCNDKFGARFQTRSNGSRYKYWRCLEAHQSGKPKIDDAGNEVGCSSKIMRNEDATNIIALVLNGLKMDKTAIVNNTMRVVQSIIIGDMSGSDTKSIKQRMHNAEERKERALELYLSEGISKEEFLKKKAQIDSHLAELNELIIGIDKRNEITKQQEGLLSDITKAVNEIAFGEVIDDVFVRNILDRMVVYNNNIEVHLNMLPYYWRFAIAKAV